MTKDEALKLALEALEGMQNAIYNITGEHVIDLKYAVEKADAAEQTITTIKEALAQPEQEPVAWEQFYPDIGKPKFVAQPEQEPVALMIYHDHICYKSQADDQSFGFWCPVNQDLPFPDLPFPEGTKFYTTPPQRTWVGLSDEERQEIALEVPIDAVLITEAKLKEKNT